MPTPPHRPRRRFGQHFLIDRTVVRRIVDASDPDASCAFPVLEIGPGRGALTRELLARHGRLVAIEIDRDLAAALRDRHAAHGLEVVEADVTRVGLAEIAERAGLPPSTAWRVVGNLPYNVSKPVASALVDQRTRVASAVLMFQREVADRLVAAPGTGDYGPLAVRVGLAYEVERRFDVPPSAFRPRPKVVSSVTTWRPRVEARFDDDALRACLRACFQSRRKTILNNLRAAFADPQASLADRLRAVSIDPSARPEGIDRDRFVALAAAWPIGTPR